MPVVADLHIHTDASDGLMSPDAVVKKASAMGLRAIAITDHDTVDGIASAVRSAKASHLELIPGIELSTDTLGREVHILGYGINYHDGPFLALLQSLQRSRHERAEKMIQRLSALGYKIELSAVLQHAADAAPGRPHVARALVDKGYFNSVTDVFHHLLGYNMPGYVERFKLTPKKAIEAIHETGGLAVWAHPGMTDDDSPLPSFMDAGLDGLEVYHPHHTESQTTHYRNLARQNNLLITGGSDFHGAEAGTTRDLAHCGLTSEDYTLFIRKIRK